MGKLSSKPTLVVREALDELLRRNEQTQGKEVGDMFLGPDIFVAVLRRRRVVEGEWAATDRTVDLLDLMEAHDSEMLERQDAAMSDDATKPDSDPLSGLSSNPPRPQPTSN